jgi:hypothetical protein
MPISGLLIKVGLWAALIFTIIGVIWKGTSAVYNKIYDKGVVAERERWQEKENRESRKRNAEIVALQMKIADAEAAYNKRANETGQKLTVENENASKRKDADTRNALAGNIRLRCNPDTTRRGDAGGAKKGDTKNQPSDNDKAGPELSGEVAANLLGLANDADRDVRQLGAAQQEIESLNTFIAQACNGETDETSTVHTEAKNRP